MRYKTKVKIFVDVDDKCDGIDGEVSKQTTGDSACVCMLQHKANDYVQGWVCPRCNKDHSPHTLTCNCFPCEIYNSGSTSDYVMGHGL